MCFLKQIWAMERIPICRPRVIYIPKEGDNAGSRKVAHRASRKKQVVDAQPPTFGSQFQHGVDAFAVR